jgi:hypothetical protein
MKNRDSISRKSFLSRCVSGAASVVFSAGAGRAVAEAVGSPAAESALPFEMAPAGAIDTGLKCLSGVAIGADHRVYAAGNEGVRVFAADGSALYTIATDRPACCVEVDAEGCVYVAQRTRVERFDAEGRRLAAWGARGEGAGEFRYITGLAPSGDFVYVADAGNRRVHRFACDGDFVDDRGGFQIPSGYFDCAADASGVLHVGHTARHRIERYAPGGELVGTWGEQGNAPERFCGCCNPTNLALFPDGRVVTSEKGIPRVKVHDAEGKLLAHLSTESFVPPRVEGVRLVEDFERDGGEEMACHDGAPGIDVAVDSAGRVAIANPRDGSVRFYRLAPARRSSETI